MQCIPSKIFRGLRPRTPGGVPPIRGHPEKGGSCRREEPRKNYAWAGGLRVRVVVGVVGCWHPLWGSGGVPLDA